MDFKYYDLFSKLWYSLHRKLGVDPHDSDKYFMPLLERVTKGIDESRGLPSCYIYWTIRGFLGHHIRRKVRDEPRKFQYVGMNMNNVTSPKDMEYINNNYIKSITSKIKLNNNERELLNLILFEEPGINISQASKKIGRYSVSNGDRLFKSILNKIKRVVNTVEV